MPRAIRLMKNSKHAILTQVEKHTQDLGQTNQGRKFQIFNRHFFIVIKSINIFVAFIY